MKTKKETDSLNKKLHELTDENLAGVSGGDGNNTSESGGSTGAFAVGDKVNLVATYYGDSYAEKTPSTYACGWPDLIIGNIISGRQAPYRIDHEGQAIGWAPESSITKKL